MWKDLVIVNGIVFTVYHFRRHRMGEMLVASRCICGALMQVECSKCRATSMKRIPYHSARAHEQAVA